MVGRLNWTTEILDQKIKSLFTAQLVTNFSSTAVSDQTPTDSSEMEQLAAQNPDHNMNCHVAGSNNNSMPHDGELCESAYAGDIFYSKYFYAGTEGQSFVAMQALAFQNASAGAGQFCARRNLNFIETNVKALSQKQLESAGIKNSSFVKVYGACTESASTGSENRVQSGDGHTADTYTHIESTDDHFKTSDIHPSNTGTHNVPLSQIDAEQKDTTSQ